MRWIIRTAALWCVLLGSAGLVQAQTPTDTPTDTPTNTPTNTPTVTPTNTPTATITPTMLHGGALVLQQTCASPPCNFPVLKSRGGYKTVAVATTAGSATIKIICRPAAGWNGPEYEVATLSGATCSTAANCFKEFQTWCDELWVRVTACTDCRVSAWLRTEPTQ